MAIIHDILEDERKRLLELKKRYEDQLADLPKGTISIKERRGRDYCYLAFRDGDKVRFKYLGLPESQAVAEAKSALSQRKDIEANLKQVRQSLQEVERSLRGRK
ncbi:MAG: hypothetical protein KAU31_01205 [Spirochaetaceae bacterium]|nr:hypothetical protein [Spirochaetaceae bacterium]